MKALSALAAAAFVAACGAATPPATAVDSAVVQAVTESHVRGTVARGAVVVLLPATGEEPLPAGPAVMDQIARQFEPAVLYARVGQPVEFRNSEDMQHNVTATRRGPGTEIFNVGTEPHQKFAHTFDRPGQYDILCDEHAGMQAMVVVADGGRATISDEAGRFSFAAVPLGQYRLKVTFEGRTLEQRVDVAGPHTEVAGPRR